MSVCLIVLIDFTVFSPQILNIHVFAFVGVTVIIGEDAKSLLCFLLNIFLISVCLLGLTVTPHSSVWAPPLFDDGLWPIPIFVLTTSWFIQFYILYLINVFISRCFYFGITNVLLLVFMFNFPHTEYWEILNGTQCLVLCCTVLHIILCFCRTTLVSMCFSRFRMTALC